jgi:protein-S-isoprenylcysteine O-methyltransferase Ste14
MNKFQKWYNKLSFIKQVLVDLLILVFLFGPVFISLDHIDKWPMYARVLLIIHHLLAIALMVNWLRKMFYKK